MQKDISERPSVPEVSHGARHTPLSRELGALADVLVWASLRGEVDDVDDPLTRALLGRIGYGMASVEGGDVPEPF
jgi:hypothetical protein